MTAAEPVEQLVTDWAKKIERHVDPDDPEAAERADKLLAEADHAEMEAIRARQAANRAAAYRYRRPSLYADAAYDRLTTDQNPRRMVSTWWDKGPRSLVLAGPSRTGKTTAAYAITNDVHERNIWVIAVSAADLSAALKPDGDEFMYDYVISCDLLLIDDLGRERVTDWWLEQVQRIVDARRSNEKRLIVTTNTQPDPQVVYDELSGRYGTPVAERLIDDGGILILDGPAHRRVVSEW